MANNIPVNFKFGNLANLPATKSQGTLYITKDERAIYFDVSADTRIRVGDFQSFATLAELEAYSNPSTTALYYVEELNVLAKWDGSKYVQINKDTDTGATSVQTVGDGNAVTTASYDPATRKITLTKGVTFALPSDITSAINALDLANTYDAKGAAAAAEAAAKSYADTAAQAAADGKDTAIAAAKKAGDDAQSDVDALELKVGTIPAGATATTVVGYAKELADAATYDDTALKGRVKAIEDDYLKAADKTELSGRIKTIEDDYLTASDKTDLQSAIALKQDELGFEGSYDKSTNKVVTKNYLDNAIAGLTGAMHFVGVVAEFPASPENGDVVIKGNKEYVYAESDSKWHELGDETIYAVKGEIVDADIAANAAIAQSKVAGLTTDIARIGAIEAKEVGWDDAETKAHTHSNKALLDTYTQTENDLADAVSKKHEHSNKTVLDGITAAKVSAWDAAEQNAKDYADGLASNYDAAGAAATAKSEVIGTSSDAKTADTVNGAKAFATDAATTAKNDVLGNASTDTSSSKTIEGTRKYVDEQIQNGLSWGTF